MQEAIKKHRLRLGLSQEELAHEVECKRSTIACYEGGYIKPSLDVAKKLAKLFGISLDELASEPVSDNDIAPEEAPSHAATS